MPDRKSVGPAIMVFFFLFKRLFCAPSSKMSASQFSPEMNHVPDRTCVCGGWVGGCVRERDRRRYIKRKIRVLYIIYPVTDTQGAHVINTF